MDVLYAVSEAYPFAGASRLAEIAGQLPAAVRKMGVDIRVIMPLYDAIARENLADMELLENFTVQLNLESLYVGVYRLERDGVIWYFVENDRFFGRKNLYGYPDDDKRFALFSQAVCVSLRHQGWQPDLVHCNDWQTALIPFYMHQYELRHPQKKHLPVLFSVHNPAEQGVFRYQTLTDVFGLSGSLFSEGIMELGGGVNLLKGACYMADGVTTVSESALEQLTQQGTAEPGRPQVISGDMAQQAEAYCEIYSSLIK